MSNTKGTALQTAMGGGKVSDRQAKSALGEAVGKIGNLTKRASHSKDAMIETGTQVLHTAETQGSLFLASLAEGYFGPDKLKIGGVDLRAPVGLIAQGYGLYETMSGRKGGSHSLAIGNGLMGSWLASVAVNAGKTLAEKGAAPASPANVLTPASSPSNYPASPPPVILTPSVQGSRLLPPPEPETSGSVREVLLTPSIRPESRENQRSRAESRPRREPGRFVRAALRDDE